MSGPRVPRVRLAKGPGRQRPAPEDEGAAAGQAGQADPDGVFAAEVEDALRVAGWEPGRWDIRQAEFWADSLRAHLSPAGHAHSVLPSAVEVWAEFGGLRVEPVGAGRQIAPSTLLLDPLAGLHAARTLGDLGRALGTSVCPVGAELPEEAGGAHGVEAARALLAVDAEGRVYALDDTGDWYLGPDFPAALTTLLTGVRPRRLLAP